MAHENPAPSPPIPSADPAPRPDVGAIVGRGAIAGLAAGLVFILANMWHAGPQKPATAPLLSISTVFHASDKPVMMPSEVIVGLVLHVALSLAFGVIFAVAVGLLRLDRNPAVLTAAAAVYGLLLYVVNFQILGRLFFPFFVSPAGPSQGFEWWIHPVAFGLVLVPFFLAFPLAKR